MKKFNIDFSDNKILEALSEHLKKAKDVIADKDKTLNLTKEVIEKLKKNSYMDTVIEDVRLLCSMVADYVKKKYMEIPVATIAMVVAALLYFLSPIDLIPDFIMGLGLIDDMAVITFVLKAVHSDIQKYKNWKKNSNDELAKQIYEDYDCNEEEQMTIDIQAQDDMDSELRN